MFHDALPLPVKVLSSSDSTKAVCVGKLGKHTDVVAVLKRHACGHILYESAAVIDASLEVHSLWV